MTWLSDEKVGRLVKAATWPDLTGTRYRATAELGRGGMGSVYLATDEVLDREVAIKVAAGPRVHAEALVQARLEHPGIVPIHDSGTLPDGRSFYVMKVVRGVTLTEHLRTTPGLVERLRIFERICEPVAFAHDRGILHRDLKPDNIMVGSFGEVLVLDWGLAQDPSRAGELVVAGTPGFMSPEQAVGARADVRADVYSLGAILGVLLQGGGVPRPLAAAWRMATAQDPADRYESVPALAAEIGRFQAGLPLRAYPESGLEKLRRVAARHRTAILLVAGYIVMRVVVAFLQR